MCIGLDSGAKLHPNGTSLVARPLPHRQHINPRHDTDLKIASPHKPTDPDGGAKAYSPPQPTPDLKHKASFDDLRKAAATADVKQKKDGKLARWWRKIVRRS